MAHEIEVVGEIAVLPERVFAAWTQAQHIKAWWNDPDEFRTVGFECDLRVGGLWKVCFEAKDGTTFDVEGAYRRVDQPSHLSFTWKPDWAEIEPTLVEMEFVAGGSGTRFEVSHHGLTSAEDALDNKDAWLKAFGWLKAYLERTA